MNDFIEDVHSFSKPVEACVSHLQWNATIDFSNRCIHATALWQLAPHQASRLILDTKDLLIDAVFADGVRVDFTIGKSDDIKGCALIVPLQKGITKNVTVIYKTSSAAAALQWLDPHQTAGKNAPCLFTQSQAILARSWVPCQDSPSVRFTYEATIRVPENLMPLMSASNPQQLNSAGIYRFEMKQPIPSYLLALCVGDFRFKEISNRCGIYAEPSVLEKAVWEFADLEKMVSTAERLYGAYPWERYDVVVLPPSFPFGGMENPRLTFVTPTILAGDRSLTSLIAHELAHSWSGNLVTNATWNDFWLNEGFTVYFEHRIMEKLYGKDYSEMLASLALDDLKTTIDDLTQRGLVADTRLKLNLNNRNPDDGVTDIAYNKGYYFLRRIEELVGRNAFDDYLKKYFHTHAFQSMNTNSFIDFTRAYFLANGFTSLSMAFFNDWIFSEGLPRDCPQPNAQRFNKVDQAVEIWLKENTLPELLTNNWSTHEWLHFLQNLPENLSDKQLTALDALGNFTSTGNAEILAVWFVIVVRNQYANAYDAMENFLIHTGRRKFLTPIYQELVKTKRGKEIAKRIYEKARPNYHFVATNTFDALLKK